MDSTEAIVEFEYKAQNDDELTIAVGEIIKNCRQKEDGWMEGELNGKTGLFPDNFVKVQAKSTNIMSDAKARQAPGKKGPREATKRESLLKEKNRQAKVLFDYEPQNKDELMLKVGDVLEILGEEEEGWFKGVIKGKVGVFPSNFVKEIGKEEKLSDSEKKDHTKDNSEKTESLPESQTHGGKKIHGGLKGPGFGNIFKDGGPKLKPVSWGASDRKLPHPDSSDNKTNHKVPPKKPPPPTPGDIQHSKQNVEKCKVTFPYEAENEDELTLTEGDIITLISRAIEDAGWWKGELNGKVGVFPDNFVELLPSEEPRVRLSPAGKQPPPPRPESLVGGKDRKYMVHDTGSPQEKPQVPSKKPTLSNHKDKHSDQASSASNTPNKISEKVQDHTTDDSSFDQVASLEKLTHLKRIKGPPERRPPSTIFLKDNESIVTNGDEKDGQEKEKSSVKPAVPSKVPSPAAAAKPHSLFGGSTFPAEQPGNALSLELMQKQLKNLQESSISRKEFQMLQSENQELKQEIKVLKSALEKTQLDFKRQLEEVMEEIDEEKKDKLSIKVEIDRVKKLVKHQT